MLVADASGSAAALTPRSAHPEPAVLLTDPGSRTVVVQRDGVSRRRSLRADLPALARALLGHDLPAVSTTTRTALSEAGPSRSFEMLDGTVMDLTPFEVAAFSYPELDDKMNAVDTVNGVEWLAKSASTIGFLNVIRRTRRGDWSISGAVVTKGVHYRIGGGDGQIVIEELDALYSSLRLVPDDVEPLGPPPSGYQPAAARWSSAGVRAQGYPGIAFPRNSATASIDVLLIGDPGRSGPPLIPPVTPAQMQTTIDQTNWALSASGVNARVRGVGTITVSYDAHTRSAPEVTQDITNRNHPVFGIVNLGRDVLGADLIALHTTAASSDGRCGWASRIPADLTTADDATFSWNADNAYGMFNDVAAAECTAGFTGAHEIGHLLGANHPETNPECTWVGGATPYGWNRGYVSPTSVGGAFPADVMAYRGLEIPNYPCNTHLDLRYSNPSRNFFDTNLPSGVADQADNARAMRMLVPYIENYRVAHYDQFAPPSDVDLSGWPQSPARFDLVARSAWGGQSQTALIHKYANDSTWSGWEQLPGAIVGGPSAASRGYNSLDVVARGTDNAVWWWYWRGAGWGGPISLGGTATADPEISARDANNIDVVVRGTGGQAYLKTVTRYPGDAGYSQAGWTSLGGTIVGGPTIVASTVYAPGADNALWEWTFGPGWVSRGGTLTSDPDSMRVGVGPPRIVVRSTTSYLWMWRPLLGWSNLGTFGSSVVAPTIASSNSTVTVAGRLDGDKSLRSSPVVWTEQSSPPPSMTTSGPNSLTPGLN